MTWRNAIPAQVVQRLEAIRDSGAIAKMDEEEAEALERMNRKSFCCF